MLRKFGFIAISLSGLLLAGCGGGAGDVAGGTGGGSSSVGSRAAVAGPLTPVQNTLSTSVLQPLAQATAGTPLSGVVSCADFAVNGDTLNIVNALANGIQGVAQNPQAIANVAPLVQGQVQQLVTDLQQLLSSLAGGAACNSSGSTTALSADPLAGTPLAPLSAALLPVLAQVTAANQSGTPSLSQLAAQLSQISTAFNTAYAQLPSSATSAPVLGGVLLTLKGTVTSLVALLQTAANGDPTTTTAALQSLVTATLQNLLLNVLPVNAIQTPTSSTAISNPITAAIAQLTSVLGTGLGSSASTSSLQASLTSALAPVLTTLSQSSGAGGATFLTSLLSQLTGALSGVSSGGTGASAVTGLLTTVVSTLTGTLSSILGGAGTGTSGSCLFANTPLSVLCTALGGV
ncbi:MAG: hypothetical protein ACRETM_07590 [Stenotrophobium sp.]